MNSEPHLWQKVAELVDVYGRFDGHLLYSESEASFANNSSRFGFRANQTLQGGFSVFGRGEWRVNLGDGDARYNVSENPDTGLGSIESTSSSVIGTRIGLVGVGLGTYGTLTLGKQWSVYYDISGWTDQYTVFGARGSSTFNAGTDGGQTGTGRANDAVVYRVQLGPLKLGLQAQLQEARYGSVDGLSGSLSYAFGNGLQVGVAYNHAFFSPQDFDVELVGYDAGDGQALTSGVTFEGAGWLVASLNTWTRNQEFVSTPEATVAFGTLGSELFVAHTFEGRLMAYAGFDIVLPRELDTRFVDARFATRSCLGGVRWLFEPKLSSFAYLEGRIGDSYDATGARVADTVVLGLHLEYSLRKGLGLDP